MANSAAPTATGWKAFKSQSAKLAQTQEQLTPSQGYLSAAGPNAASSLMGRLGRVSAPATGPAYGNSVVTSDARGEPAAQPGKGTGQGIANAYPYPQREVVTPPSQVNAQAYGGYAYQHGRLIASDRHVLGNTGRTASSDQEAATGGSPNPEASGPARPSYRMLNRTLSWQVGTDSTRGLDNGGFHATTEAGGKNYPLGTQGDPWSKKYGGTPGLYNFRPYGTRGGFGPGAPAPRVTAEPGGPYRFGTLLSQGSPEDGPQKIYGGLPWGLHSATVPPAQVTNATQRFRFGQLRPQYINRPLNSKAAGQSYDQQVVHLDGTQAVKLPKVSSSRTAGVSGRFLMRGGS